MICAGSKMMVNRRASMTPIAAKNPNAPMGAILAPAKESRPPAVVRLVIKIANPEWPIA